LSTVLIGSKHTHTLTLAEGSRDSGGDSYGGEGTTNGWKSTRSKDQSKVKLQPAGMRRRTREQGLCAVRPRRNRDLDSRSNMGKGVKGQRRINGECLAQGKRPAQRFYEVRVTHVTDERGFYRLTVVGLQ
jgi:hypothetical protein